MNEEEKNAVIDIVERLHEILKLYDKLDSDYVQKIVASIAFIGAFLPSSTLMELNLLMMKTLYESHNVKELLNKEVK